MISQKTAGKIWTTYREIANGEKLLEELAHGWVVIKAHIENQKRLLASLNIQAGIELNRKAGDEDNGSS